MNQMETLKERIEEEREKLNRLALGDDLEATYRSYWTGWSRNIWTGRVPEKRRNRKYPPTKMGGYFIFNIKSRTAVLRKRQK